MKNYDTIGNRTRDLPACSAVHQPTAPQRAHSNTNSQKLNSKKKCNNSKKMEMGMIEVPGQKP